MRVQVVLLGRRLASPQVVIMMRRRRLVIVSTPSEKGMTWTRSYSPCWQRLGSKSEIKKSWVSLLAVLVFGMREDSNRCGESGRD